jgi:hypothetical protein
MECGVSLGALVVGTPLYFVQQRRQGTTEIQGEKMYTESTALLGGIVTDT